MMTYPYDTYQGDTTPGILESVLAHFSMEKRSLFFAEEGPIHPCRWG